jgi:hypothetical protein
LSRGRGEAGRRFLDVADVCSLQLL